MGVIELSDRFAQVDFAARHGELATDAARCTAAGRGTAGLEPLALVVGDQAVTLIPGAAVAIAAGIDAAATCVVEFASARAFSDFYHELRTVPGAQITRAVRYRAGGYAAFDDWEPALRALYQGRPVYDPEHVDRTRMHRVFRWDRDPDADIGAFVGEFGFAVVRSVFTSDEIDRIDRAIAALESDSTPDTPGTWWTTDAAGTPQPCQLHYATERAHELGWIDRDERMARLVDACIPGLVAHADRMNGHFAVLKRPGASEGLTDLPWHIDCGLGGHSLSCPGIHIGLQLTASNPAVGAFSVLAGSQFTSVRRRAVDTATWPVVTVDTAPGDVTIHVPHLMHAAPTPTGRNSGRRTLYLGYGRPEAHELIGVGEAFDDLLSRTSPDGFVSFDDRRLDD